MKDNIILSAKGLSKVYPGNAGKDPVRALKALDLEVKRGEFLAVVGASGCGKSTLIDLIAGFSKPSSGELLVNGAPVTRPGPDRIVVFQDHAVFPWFTAAENVAYGLHQQGTPRKLAIKEAKNALGMIGLSDFTNAYPATLSGGMRQRVALARALVLRPQILLLDEPFAALDAMTRSRLQDELISMWQEYGWTVIFVTHTLTEATYLADRVLILRAADSGRARVEDIPLTRPRSRLDNRIGEFSKQLSQHLHYNEETEECLCTRLIEKDIQ